MYSKEFWRMVSTATMWMVLGIISVMAVIFSVNLGDNAAVAIVLPLVMGVIGTAFIYGLPEAIDLVRGRQDGQHRAEQQPGKGKRGESDKLMLLMQLMDDDERAAFKETLRRSVLRDARLSDDGELPLSAAYFEDEAR